MEQAIINGGWARFIASVFARPDTTKELYVRFCNRCGSRLPEAALRFCSYCGAQLAAEPAAPRQEHATSLRPEGAAHGASGAAVGGKPVRVVGAGQWAVGLDVKPGLYRFRGYAARLDRQMAIIQNENAESGLGLLLVRPEDSYLEISGEAIRVEELPNYDPIIEGARDGTYLVNTDLRAGSYRVHADGGGSAYFALLDRNMDLMANNVNAKSLILNLPHDVYAVQIVGRLERLDAAAMSATPDADLAHVSRPQASSDAVTTRGADGTPQRSPSRLKSWGLFAIGVIGLIIATGNGSIIAIIVFAIICALPGLAIGLALLNRAFEKFTNRR